MPSDYAAMITRMDADVGRILDLVKELDIDERTLIFFCSDNGAANRYEGLFDSSGILRGRKRDVYEGGIRTLMIARWPGKVPAGKTDATPWYFADFLPTTAAIADVKPRSNVDGTNMLPSILGHSQPTDDETVSVLGIS